MAQAAYSKHDYTEAAELVSMIDAQSSCATQAKALLNSIKKEMDKQYNDIISMEKEKIRSDERIKSAQIKAIKDIATAYFERQTDDVKEKISNNDIKHKIDDSLFVQRIIDGNFFVDEFSQELDYNLVVRHCLSHTDEQYDETFADGLSKMLVKYPEKIKGILKAISLLPAEQQNRTYHNLKIYIISAWIMGNYTDSIDIDTFYKTYPFFKKDSATDEILKEQIKSIIG